MSKTKLPAILLNNDFYSKPRNKKWIREHGFEAIAILQCVWIAISQDKDCRFLKEEVEFLDYPIPFELEKIITVLTSAVEVGLLEEEDGYYYNSQISEKHENFRKKREVYTKNATKRWNGKKDDNANTKEKEVNSNAIAYANDNDLQCKSILPLPLPLTLSLDINKNSEPDLPPEIEGRKQCRNGKFVYLSDIDRENLKLNYLQNKIDLELIPEGIFILSEHIEKNYRSPDGQRFLKMGQEKALEMLTKSWVKTELRKRQVEKTRLEKLKEPKEKPIKTTKKTDLFKPVWADDPPKTREISPPEEIILNAVQGKYHERER